MELKEIEQIEREKYSELHKEGYGAPTPNTIVGDFVLNKASKNDKILELGCGNGLLVKYFNDSGYNTRGLDITLDGVDDTDEHFVEAALWEIPFNDDEFDFTFSVDVLEHVPTDLVPKVLDEIYRVTSTRTLHIVCVRPSVFREGLHPTVRDIEWWRDMFEQHGKRGVEFLTISTREFALVQIANQWRRNDD